MMQKVENVPLHTKGSAVEQSAVIIMSKLLLASWSTATQWSVVSSAGLPSSHQLSWRQLPMLALYSQIQWGYLAQSST